MRFNKTHIVLIKATTGNYGYDVKEIDINSGLFRDTNIDSSKTHIRVKEEVFAEQIIYGEDSLPLSAGEIEMLEMKFNSIRAQKGWSPVVFRKTQEVNDEVSNSPEIQGQKKAKAV